MYMLVCGCSLHVHVDLTKEFLMIYDKCPSRLQKKISEPMKSQVWLYTFTWGGGGRSVHVHTHVCVEAYIVSNSY